jgi:hypothetical protein
MANLLLALPVSYLASVKDKDLIYTITISGERCYDNISFYQFLCNYSCVYKFIPALSMLHNLSFYTHSLYYCVLGGAYYIVLNKISS